MADSPSTVFLERWREEVQPGLDPRVFVDIRPMHEFRCLLKDIEVQPPSSRRQGIGTSVLNAVTRLADETGTFITLYPEPSRFEALAAYYERFGFVQVAEGTMEYEPVEPNSNPQL